MALPVIVRTDLQNQFDALVQSVLAPAGQKTEVNRAWRPATAVSETETTYVVELEVPGVKREDVSIEVEDGKLAVTGEFKESENGGQLRSRTRRTGRFEYRTRLPRGTDADQVSAALADGVLTVTIPKPEAATPRRVEIHQG